ncbi:MAG: ribosomal RNA small subunit methyltransferase A [Bacilli bacterium]|nr:ribosomal RNA small subunit methyltransferase A [Bacilli bacterium]
MRDFNYKKRFGQNFLKDNRIVEKIVDYSEIEEDTLVVEVGPGKGILTKELSRKAKNVLCYEIDEELQYDLIKLQEEYKNVNFKFCDFLSADLISDLKEYKYKHLYFISNVPYYITTPILMKIMDSKLPFEKIVMMVQKEVGDRFSAKPGSKNYSSITVFLNYFYNIKKLFNVSRAEFIPVPNVDSEVVSFEIKKNRIISKNEELFFNLVRDSFKFKRKTIKNNLKNYDLNKIGTILKNNGFDLGSRAETIPYQVFVEISNAL